MAWLILILCALIIFAGFRQLWIVAYGFYNDKPKYWNGPAPAKEQRQVTRQHIVEFLAKYPDSGLAKSLPELAEQAKVVRAYEELNARYEAGEIDEIDFNIELQKITEQIDISEFTPEKPPILPQRYY